MDRGSDRPTTYNRRLKELNFLSQVFYSDELKINVILLAFGNLWRIKRRMCILEFRQIIKDVPTIPIAVIK